MSAGLELLTVLHIRGHAWDMKISGDLKGKQHQTGVGATNKHEPEIYFD